MGKVEKVIVLSVLFLIALILVVSLTVDDPLDKSRVVEAGATRGHADTPAAPGAAAPGIAGAPALVASDAPAGGQSAPGLLSMPITPNPPANAPTANGQAAPAPAPEAGAALVPSPPAATMPSGLPAGALLKSSEGLQDSILRDMKLYTWKEGDSYRLIAHKYYGDWNKYTVLRRSNEGRTDVQPGEQIFVPVFDSDPSVAAAPTPAPGTPKTTKPSPGSKKATSKGTAPIAAKAGQPSGKKTHVVKEGESLWKIARAELGDGGRWQEIYELNKDVLPSEKAVHPGQTLRIP
jgi:nucleoid-associated protein YgaU